MTLTQRLSEFRFNLETIDLLTSMGRSTQQTIDEMSQLGFSSQNLQFILSSRTLLNSVLLRVTLYNEQNLTEAKIRSNLSILNNQQVNNLVDTMLLATKSTNVSQPVENVKTVVKTEEVCEELEEDEENVEDEVSRLDQFYNKCIRKTTEPTDIIKTGEVYTAFSNWWTTKYTDQVLDKNDVKDFLNAKLGKSNKNTWSNAELVLN
jgi:hypothetical protein